MEFAARFEHPRYRGYGDAPRQAVDCSADGVQQRLWAVADDVRGEAGGDGEQVDGGVDEPRGGGHEPGGGEGEEEGEGRVPCPCAVSASTYKGGGHTGEDEVAKGILQRAWTARVAGEGGPKDAHAHGVEDGEAGEGEGERRVEGGGEQRADLRREGGERHRIQMEHTRRQNVIYTCTTTTRRNPQTLHPSSSSSSPHTPPHPPPLPRPPRPSSGTCPPHLHPLPPPASSPAPYPPASYPATSSCPSLSPFAPPLDV